MNEDAGRRPAFVGREREMADIRAAVADALAGRGRLVLVAGEPGIGKTHLCEQVAEYARRSGANVLWGRCYEGEGAPPFWAWVQVLRSAMRPLDAQALQAVLGSSAGAVTQVVPEIREQLPDLPYAVSVDSPQARFRLFDGIARFLHNLASRQPLVVIIDDLHGADPASFLLLQFVARGLRSERLLLLAAYRDIALHRDHPLTELVAETLREPGTERVRLPGFTTAEVAGYIQLTTGVQPAAALVATVHKQTEGNPFFVGELVRMLLTERGTAAINDPSSATAIRIPESVKAVTNRRLVPLSPECHEVLRIASVLGREFSRELLGQVMAGPAVVFHALEEAVATGVLTEALEAGGRYRFSHILIRDALYEDLHPLQRVSLHRRIGRAIERSSTAASYLGELVHHFFEAGRASSLDRGRHEKQGPPRGDRQVNPASVTDSDQDADDNLKAADYAQRAAAAAVTLLSYEEAVRLYRIGLEALNRDGQRRSPANLEHLEQLRGSLLAGLEAALNSKLRYPTCTSGEGVQVRKGTRSRAAHV